jgi:hypothetical protein
MTHGARTRPLHKVVSGLGVDYAILCDTTFGGPVAANVLPLELPGRVSVGVDREAASDLERESQEVAGRILSLRARVDLNGDVIFSTCSEYGFVIEVGLRSTAAGDDASGAVTQDVHVRVADCTEHALRHDVAV